MRDYTLYERLGRGATGDVFRARDTRAGRTVAVRVLAEQYYKEDEERRTRLLQEARAAAALSHPNIATLFELGEEDGRPFLVFEFAPGETIRTLTGGQPLPVRRALDLTAQVADALAEAHAHGVTHPELGPDKVIVTPKGHAKVIDFGLVSWAPRSVEEQGAGQYRDLFALGALLYQMLTGQSPFGETRAGGPRDRVDQSTPYPSTVNPAVPPAVESIVWRAMATRPTDQFASAPAFAAVLREAAASLEAASASRKPVERRLVTVRSERRPIMVALILLAAVIGVVWWLRGSILSWVAGILSP